MSGHALVGQGGHRAPPAAKNEDRSPVSALLKCRSPTSLKLPLLKPATVTSLESIRTLLVNSNARLARNYSQDMALIDPMQAVSIGAIIAVAAGFVAKSISNAWVRLCVIGAFSLLPILSAALVLFLEDCDDRLSNGMCKGAGLTIMGVMAIMPFWLLGLPIGWWLKHRQRSI